MPVWTANQHRKILLLLTVPQALHARSFVPVSVQVVSVLQDLLDAERGPGSRGKSSASRPSLGQDPGAPAALAPAASSLEADSAPPMAGSAASLTSSLQIVSHVAASPAQQHGSMRPADDAGQCPSSKPVSAGCSCVIC
jgi:hypothetical protein